MKVTVKPTVKTETTQQTLTTMINAVEIDAIASAFAPCPLYAVTMLMSSTLEFILNIEQEHVSWPPRPKPISCSGL